MSKIERIKLNYEDDKGTFYKVPYTSSIFVFGVSGLVSGNSKYFHDSITSSGIDEEEEYEDIPVTISFRSVYFQFNRKYLVLIDGIPYSYYLIREQDTAILIRSKCSYQKLSDNSSRSQEFERFLDSKELDNKNYLYIGQRLKRLSIISSPKSIKSGEFPLDLALKEQCFFITCNGFRIKCTRIVTKKEENAIDFSLADVSIPNIDYDELFDFLESPASSDLDKPKKLFLK